MGKIPARHPKSTALSTWESTWLDPSRQPCRLGGRLMVAGQFCLVHLFSVLARFLGLVRNLMVQVDPRVNPKVLITPNLYK